MRVYGRTYNEDGTYQWVTVQTEPNGLNDYVYATALVQVLYLNLGESPFWGAWGIPAYQSVMSQIAPNYNTVKIQNYYSQFFMFLSITKIKQTQITNKTPSPTYAVNILTHYGVPYQGAIPK